MKIAVSFSSVKDIGEMDLHHFKAIFKRWRVIFLLKEEERDEFNVWFNSNIPECSSVNFEPTNFSDFDVLILRNLNPDFGQKSRYVLAASGGYTIQMPESWAEIYDFLYYEYEPVRH